ncbi:hypothetical protein GE061_008459 [Apolygus lucorum]|uniref:PDEase domain-containing protein n=1 Tax=Apolygus lucorum TaxID=248454 RepID=A0A8S9WPY5_APOLU|nr:hypothetical protein GE061_008459 [Apolygus lucorum]
MVLIKVADISNEARPLEVAEPWLDRLLQEFFTQSDAEKIEGLPVTPFMDREKITKPSSQCSFIGFVLLPLFEALGELLTELVPMMIDPVRSALEYYRRLNEAHHKNSIADAANSSNGPSGPPSPTKHTLKSQSSYSVRKTSITFSQHPDEEDEDMIADISTDEEETVTEVAVSEKTLKFKISTESSSDRKSITGSRKGSRERPADDDDDRICDSCHRRDTARSHSLVEPEWRYGGAGSPSSNSDKGRRSASTGREEKKEYKSAPASPAPPKSPGIVSRLKRLGWRSTGEEKISPGSPASLKDQHGSDEPLHHGERRASTLPKENRKRFASEARKGWRGLLGKRDEPTTSKPNGLSTESIGDSVDSSVNNNRRKNKLSVDGSPHRQRWMTSLVSSFRSKKSKSVYDSPKS